MIVDDLDLDLNNPSIPEIVEKKLNFLIILFLVQNPTEL